MDALGGTRATQRPRDLPTSLCLSWVIAAAILLAAILLMTPGLAEAGASTRIVTRANAREIIAMRPQGGRPQTLVHLHRGQQPSGEQWAAANAILEKLERYR